MKELKNPFALRKSDGHIIMIADLSPEQRGKSCNYVCPECNADFLARMGDIRVPHFAHSGEPCDAVKALMGALYQLMQEALSESKRFTVPNAYTFFGTANYVKHEGSRTMNIIWRLDRSTPVKFLKKTNKLMVL